MSQFRAHLVIFAAAALLSGCSYLDSVFTGENTSNEDQYPPADTEQVQIPPSTAEQNAQPAVTQAPSIARAAVGAGNGASQPVTPGGTGTHVGRQVVSLRGDLQRLQGNINQHNQELR